MRSLVVVLLMWSIAGALPASAGAVAESWQCRNADVEISCDRGGCEAKPQGGFTPMSVELDEAGAMSVCAYSGCWQGPAEVLRRGSFLLFTGQALAWSGTNPDAADFAAVLDTSDAVAVLKGAGFAHPMTCE